MISLKNNVTPLRILNNKHTFQFLKIFKKFNFGYDPTKDYYKILGINQSASESEIKQAYYKLAKIHHPDVNKGKSSEIFKDINQAYEILSDKEKKIQYDASRKLNSFWGAKNYKSNNTYNTWNNNNNSNYDYNYRNKFYHYDFFYKYYNNYNSSKDYRSNFTSEKKKYNFGKNYYERNSQYFSSFKNFDGNQYYNDKPKSKTKKEASFGKDYYKRNKKYYDTFKNKEDFKSDDSFQNQSFNEENPYHRNSNLLENQVFIFFLSMFGIVLGTILIKSLFSQNRQSMTPKINYQNKNPYNQSNLNSSQGYNQHNNDSFTNNKSPYTSNTDNINNFYQPSFPSQNKSNETENGMRDDPFYRK